MTLDEIDAELKQLNQRRRELLAERHRLIEEKRPEAIATSQYWADPIFLIVKDYPGASRKEVLLELAIRGLPGITEQTLTNSLTTLRRRGRIENRGTRKHPEWHVRDRNAPKPVSPDPLDEIFRRSEERVVMLGL